MSGANSRMLWDPGNPAVDTAATRAKTANTAAAVPVRNRSITVDPLSLIETATTCGGSWRPIRASPIDHLPRSDHLPNPLDANTLSLPVLRLRSVLAAARPHA